MTHIHYKFSSKLSSDTVVFDGPHVTLRELKRLIMGREKLRSGDCDLQVTNAQTKEEYADDEGLIPKGSSVIVRRIPIIGAKSKSNSKTRNIERSDVQPHHTFGAFKVMEDQRSSRALPFFSKMANLAVQDVSEEDKIKVLTNQSPYDSVSYSTKFSAVLPANYTCYRCGNTGHHIRNCPTSGDKNFEAPPRLKKSTGIPRSFMVEVDDPNIKGAMLTNCGHYAIPAIHAKAYAIGKKERPPFLAQEQPLAVDESPVPKELICMICEELLSDAVVIPCCGNSFCDDCIRTTLLDSDHHICPTCNQSDVSPDTLIANKFLRQAVNTFQKERGQAKSLGGRHDASQSQHPAWAPSPVPTPPPLTMQSQPQQAVDTSPVRGAPPTTTGSAPAPSVPGESLQPVQSQQEISEDAEEKTCDDSTAAVHKDAPAASSQGSDAAAVELLQTLSATQQQSSSAPTPRQVWPSACWDSTTSTSSSSSCPTRGWSESKPPSSSCSSSYPAAAPPLFPPPHFPSFLPTQQPINSYPPGYPPTTPVWTLQTPQSAPISSLCSSTADWYMQQRRRTGRSPHGESTHRRSSSHSKSSKSKSSRSHSRSSSRSRSRSRSQSRSRPRSPYSHHRDLRNRSHSSFSYSYGYKRSPTPSSSSSPRLSHRSRSKSPSDHRKRSHHSRHHGKKSTSGRSSSRKRGDSAHRGGSEERETRHPYAQQAKQNDSSELDTQRYLQWNQEYREWCEKYFNSYVSHFHQLPPPFLNHPLPQWGDNESSRNYSCANTESHYRHHGGRAARTDDRSSLSQSSSDSHSTPSQSSSDSRSSPSHSSNDGHSPHSSGNGCSTPTKPLLKKGTKDVELQGRRQDNRQHVTDTVNFSTLKSKHRSMKKHEEGRRNESSSPDAADSTNECRKKQRRHNTGPNACKDGAESQETGTSSAALESETHLDKYFQRKGGDSSLKIKKGRGRGQYSESKQDVERRHREKPNKGADRCRNPAGGGKGSDSGSKNPGKRKGKGPESSVDAQISKCLNTNVSEVPQTCESEPQSLFDKKQPKMEKKREKKTWPLTEKDVWEGGITVKPQKKISINISLDKRRDEEKTDQTDLARSARGTTEESEKSNIGEEENLNREGTEKEEFSREQNTESKEKMKPDEREASPTYEETTSSEHKGQTKTAAEEKGEIQEEVFGLWHCAFRGREEEKEIEIQQEEHDEMKASNDEKSKPLREGKEEERRVWNDGRGQEMGELVTGPQKEGEHGEPKEEVKLRMKDDGSPADRQAKETMGMRTLEEDVQSRAADRDVKLTLMPVPHSRSEEKEPTSSVAVETPASSETRQEDEQLRKINSTASSSNRSSASTSHRDRPGSTSSTRRDRGKESERQKESRKSKDTTREDKKGRDRERERSQKVSPRSYSRSHDMERRDRKRGDDQGGNKSSCCPAGKSSCGSSLETQLSAHKSYEDLPHYHHNTQTPSGNHRHKDQPVTETDHQSRGKERDLLSSEFMQNRSTNKSKKEREEWKQNMDEVTKEGKWQGDYQYMLADSKRGPRWEDEVDGPARQTNWELEEGERPSSKSGSSSVSRESSSSDNRGKEWQKKPKKNKREKRPAASDLLEEGELRRHKHKKPKRSRDGGEQ